MKKLKQRIQIKIQADGRPPLSYVWYQDGAVIEDYIGPILR